MGLTVYSLLDVAPNSAPSLGRKASDSMPLTRLPIVVMAPLVLLNVTRAVVFEMPYNVPLVGQ